MAKLMFEFIVLKMLHFFKLDW